MPVVCRFKPNRTFPRKVTAKAVERFVCSALENGESRKSLEDAVAKCLGPATECDCDRIEVRLQEVLRLLEAILLILVLLQPLTRVLRIIKGVVALPKSVTTALPSLEAGARQLENAKPAIEGVFVRVNNELVTIRSAQARAAEIRIIEP